MERITFTTKCSWGIKGNIDDAIIRLAAIENILGSNYDLERLRQLVQDDKDSQCVELSEPSGN